MDLYRLPLEHLTVTGLWSALDEDTRRLAARSLYEDAADRSESVEADVAIARTLRFRIVAVRRLPVDRRVDYLARAVQPDESLATKLLRGLHLNRRRDLLGAFLEALGIPHSQGVIDENYDFDAHRPDAERLRAALAALYERFPRADVDLYAVTLLAMDRDSWAPLADLIADRS